MGVSIVRAPTPMVSCEAVVAKLRANGLPLRPLFLRPSLVTYAKGLGQAGLSVVGEIKRGLGDSADVLQRAFMLGFVNSL